MPTILQTLLPIGVYRCPIFTGIRQFSDPTRAFDVSPSRSKILTIIANELKCYVNAKHW